MTVAELIAKLQTMPQDMEVVAYSSHEDFEQLGESGVRVAYFWDYLSKQTFPVVEIMGG